MKEIDSESWINEKAPDISLRELAAPLFRRKRVLITTFLVALTVVLLAGILMPSEYTSHMSILVNRERADPLVTTQSTAQMNTPSAPVSEEEINSEAELLKSRDVLEQVVLANGLQKQHGRSFLDLFRPKQNEADRVERAVRSLAKQIKVEAGAKTNVIEVSYSSPDPRLSYGVLNTLGNLYLAKHVAVHRPPGSYQFFARETQNYHEAMEDSEARLRSFQKQQGAAAPDLERSNLAVQVTNSVGQLHLVEEAIAADQQRLLSDRQQMRSVPQRSATLRSTSEADKLLEYLEPALLAAETKRTQLALKYNPNYPLVQEADQEVATAKAAIAAAEKTRYVTQTTDRDPTFELLREDSAKTEANLAAERANLTAIKRSIQSLQIQMVDLDQKALTQQDLLRNVKANEDNYLLYLSKREQERTSDALDKTRIANVAIAVPPDIPALPTHGFLIVVVFALAFATVLAIVMAYLVEYFDSSFHTPAQVIDMLGIPVVVAVPKKTA
jgi:polysaccharide biosynthesis protein PslE